MRAINGRPTLLGRYVDPHGRAHRVLLRGHLVLDLTAGDRPRVIAVLAAGEGEGHARSLLHGSELDEGYLARARREPRPFIRTLTRADLEPPRPIDGHDNEQPRADDEELERARAA